MTQNIGETVAIGAVQFRIVDRKSTNGSGTKFYGKFVFTLENNNGERFTAYGKRVAHNSRLTRIP